MSSRAVRWRFVVPALLVIATGSGAATLHSYGSESVVEAAPQLDAVGPVVPGDVPAAVQVAAFQPFHKGTVIAKADPRSRVTRTGLDLWQVSATASFDVPEAAMRAYRHAADVESSCGISWWFLAGIGRVESDHGRYGGSTLDSAGVSHPSIIGVALDGHGPLAAIHDTDAGRWDGDTTWDRAVGPMQFIPSTWEWAGRDGDGDGITSPNNLDDAALAAASYVCRYGPLTSESAMRTAAFGYNHSEYYVDLVLAFGHGYETGHFVIPSPPAADASDGAHPGPGDGATGSHEPSGTTGPSAPGATTSPTRGSEPTSGPTKGATQAPSPGPTSPTGSPTTSPTSSPTEPPGPLIVVISGTWAACGDGWCLDGTPLDLGPPTQYDVAAAWDYDANGTRETNGIEFAGLAGRTVAVHVRSGTGFVYAIEDLEFRHADGTFV